jgi:hypothetical protein
MGKTKRATAFEDSGVRRRRGIPTPVLGAIAALVLFSAAVDGAWAYFGRWVESPATEREQMADVAGLARALARHVDPAREEVWVGTGYSPHPTLDHLAPGLAPPERLFWGGTSLPLGPVGERPVWYGLPVSAAPPGIEDLLPESALVEEGRFSSGESAFRLYRFSPEELAALMRTLERGPFLPPGPAGFGGFAELASVRAPARAAAGQPVGVTAVWQLEGRPSAPVHFFARLVGPSHEPLAQADLPTDATLAEERWLAGRLWLITVLLFPPATAPPGVYRLETGLYLPGGAGPPPLTVEAPPVKVTPARPLRAQDVPTAPSAAFGDQIALLGADLPPDLKSDRGAIAVRLFWQAKAAPVTDYTVFVQLLDAAGHLVAQSDDPPAGGLLPTHAWDRGEIVADAHTLPLPDRLAPGDYTLIAGLYSLPGAVRLATPTGADFAVLRSYKVRG